MSTWAMSPDDFADALRTWREQRELIEAAPQLDPANAQRALDELEKQRTTVYVALADSQRTELFAEFDRVASALLKHLEN